MDYHLGKENESDPLFAEKERIGFHQEGQAPKASFSSHFRILSLAPLYPIAHKGVDALQYDPNNSKIGSQPKPSGFPIRVQRVTNEWSIHTSTSLYITSSPHTHLIQHGLAHTTIHPYIVSSFPA